MRELPALKYLLATLLRIFFTFSAIGMSQMLQTAVLDARHWQNGRWSAQARDGAALVQLTGPPASQKLQENANGQSVMIQSHTKISGGQWGIHERRRMLRPGLMFFFGAKQELPSSQTLRQAQRSTSPAPAPALCPEESSLVLGPTGPPLGHSVDGRLPRTLQALGVKSLAALSQLSAVARRPAKTAGEDGGSG